MERPIVYPSEGVADSDALRGWKASMVALGWLAQTLLGTTSLCSGLACTPGTGLNVSVAAGAIYSQKTTDATGYGSLGTDSHFLVKQGLILDPTTFSVPAPVTTGQSINYLIQATYTDTDTGSALLPYYNSANPTVPYSGPGNDGIPQMTIRRGVCTLSIKAGAPATTGSQATPSPDSGNLGLWVVTIAYGASSVSSGNIVAYSPSSIISETLTQKISQAVADARYTQPASSAQAAAGTSTTTAMTPADAALVAQTGGYLYAADTSGSANTVTAALTPALATYTAGQSFKIKIANSNTGASTVNINALGAKAVQWSGRALVGGELVSGQIISLIYDGTAFQIQGLASISGSNSSGWWTIYSDSRIEQGGYVAYGGVSEGDYPITLPIAFPNEYRGVVGTIYSNPINGGSDYWLKGVTLPSTGSVSSIDVYPNSGTGGAAWTGFTWVARGR